MANNRIVLQSGGSAGAILGTYDIFGTNAGFETVTVSDAFGSVTGIFQGDFARGGDTIRLTDVATDFTVQLSGSNVLLSSNDITVQIPIGTLASGGTTIVFENSAGNLVDSRVLGFDGTNVVLGTQVVTKTSTGVDDTGNGNSTNTFILTPGQDILVGGPEDDIFRAANKNLNAGDDLDGGAGFNILRLEVDESLTGPFDGPYTFGGFTTTNIQGFEITGDDNQAVSVDFSGTTIETFTVNNSSETVNLLAITKLNSGAQFTDDGVDLIINNVTNGLPGNKAPDINVSYEDSVLAGANDTVDIELKTSFVDDLDIGTVSTGTAGVETVNILNEQGPSELNDLDTALTTLNIKATANLKIDNALFDSVRTIDATQSTAQVDIDFSGNDDPGEGVTYTGSSGQDIVLGGNAGDSISTGDGNDIVTSDDFEGNGDGNDTIDGGEGDNTITSGDGADSITTGAGNDSIDANDGNNTVNAGDGNNFVTTDDNNDSITSGSGNDTLISDFGNDIFDSGAGDDLITPGPGLDTLDAGDGNDTVLATGGVFDASGTGVGIQDDFDFGAGTDEMRIGQSTADGNFVNVDGLEILTQTQAGNTILFNDGGTQWAQLAGIMTINTDFGYTGNDTVVATDFTSPLTINIGGGVDSIVAGNGNDTVNALGNQNLTNADTLNGFNGLGDVLNLDGDTTVSGGNGFSNFEIVNLDDDETIGANLYSLTLGNGNAPTSGPLTINGVDLQGDEGALIDSTAVTAFSIDATTGAGADSVNSGTQNDTITTNAGNDSVNIAAGGNDSVSTGDGDDTIVANGGLTSGDVIDGGANNTVANDYPYTDGGNGDVLALTGSNGDVGFTNVSDIETIRQDGPGGTLTLGANAVAAGVQQVILNDASAQTLSAAGFGNPLVVDAQAGGNDLVTTGGGDDTIVAGNGTQTFITNAGDDSIFVDGNIGDGDADQDFTDIINGGPGDDTMFLDNRFDTVDAQVNLTNVTAVENFDIFANGDIGNNGIFETNNNTLVFTGGAVNTLTQINVDASKLTDPTDSFKITLDENQTDDDFQFNVTGSSTTTIFEKLNDGTDNNIDFMGGSGDDSLIIDGGDLGSTVTLTGGAGNDGIIQDGGKIQDDGFVNVREIEYLSARNPAPLNPVPIVAPFVSGNALNATLGMQAAASGLNTIFDTNVDGAFGGGNDFVLFDAAFTNDTTVWLAGGVDNYNALASGATFTFDANNSNSLGANDTLTGGTGLDDTVNVRNETADISGVTRVENIVVIDTATFQNTVITTSGANTLSPGGSFLNVDASSLDSTDTLTFTQTVTGAAISLTGGAGDDTVTTQGTSDILNTGAGNDLVNAGNGNNTVDAGSGNDNVTTGSGADSVLGQDGDDTITTGAGNDDVDGGSGDDYINTGAPGLNGDPNVGPVTFFSGKNVDQDTITAGDGKDQIFGGVGGDTINLNADGDVDITFYTQRADSSTSNDRDTVNGFESGTDIIDVRYVSELFTNGAYTLGTAQLEFLGNFSEFGGAQGALTSATPGNVGIVFQQNTNTLWVDLNDDNVLNGDDLQIVINGLPGDTLQAQDVLDGAFVGFTPVFPNTPLTGTIINELFVLDGNGPWTLDGGLGDDTVVSGSALAPNGQVVTQNISTSNISNVENFMITNGTTVLMTIAQHNTFEGMGGFIEDSFSAKSDNQTLGFTENGTVTGTTGTGVDTYNLFDSGTGLNENDFTLGNGATNVNGANSDRDVIRTGTPDTITGNISGGTGASDTDNHIVEGTNVVGDTLVLDTGDDISGATFSGIESTVLTLSSVTMTAAQHGTDGTDGTIGVIYDAGDTGVNTNDTITIVDNANITGREEIESYVLQDGGNDTFTVLGTEANVNVTGLGGNDTIVINGLTVTGTYDLQGGGDTLLFTNTSDITGVNGGVQADGTTAETLDLSTVGKVAVTMTEGQHDGATTILGDNNDDTINLVRVDAAPTFGGFPNPDFPTFGVDGPQDDGVVTGADQIGTYNLNGLFDFTLGDTDQSAIGDGGNSQTIRLQSGTLAAGVTIDGGTGAGFDTFVIGDPSGTTDISAATVQNFEQLTINGSSTMTEGQYENNGAIVATGFNDTITLVNGGVGANGTVAGDADIQNYNLNGAFTFTVATGAQNVTGNDAQNQEVVVNGLTLTGNIDGGTGGNDTLTLNNGTDITGATISGFENVVINGTVTMTYAQYNALNPTGGLGTDGINFVGPVAAVTANQDIENYVLAAIAGNDFSFNSNGTGTESVTTSGSANDIVRTGGQTDFSGVTLDLAGNTGFVGDEFHVDTDGTDISGLNGGNETTAETLVIENNAGTNTVSMTVNQHEGFTADFTAVGDDEIFITDSGTINADKSIELYDLSAATNTINVNPLNGAVDIQDTTNTGDSDTVNIGSNTVTGTWALSNANDVLIATNGADISGVNGGGATTIEELQLTGEISMTELQHDGFGTFTAPGAADQITLTSKNGDGLVAGDAAIETYELAQSDGDFTFTVGALGQNVNETGTADNTIVFGGGVYTGTFAGYEANDVFQVVNTSDISGITGSVAGVTLDFQNLASTVTVSQTQHEAFAAPFVNTAGSQSVVIIGGGTVTGDAGIEAYDLSDDLNTFDVNAAQTGVNLTSTGGTGDIVNVAGLTVNGTWALDAGNDVITATTGADISGVNAGAVTTAEVLTFAGTVTMTAAQHEGFTSAINNAAAGTIVITTAGVVTADADVEVYDISAASNTITLPAGGIDLTDTTGTNDTVVISGTQTGNWNLTGAGDTLVTSGTSSISGVTGSPTSIENLQIDGTLSLTDAQYDTFFANSITDAAGGSGTDDRVNIVDDATITADDQIEYFRFDGGNSTVLFDGVDAIRAGQTADFGGIGGADTATVGLTTTVVNGQTDASVFIDFFAAGAGNDILNINVGATDINADFDNVNAGTDTNLSGVASANGVIVVNGLAATDLTDISNNGDVETAIGNAIGDLDAGTYAVVLENANGSDQSGVYLISLGAGVANLDSTNFDAEFIGLIDHQGLGANFDATNFA